MTGSTTSSLASPDEPGATADPRVTLRPPRQPVARRAIGWWAVRSLALTLPALALTLVGAGVLPRAQPWWWAAAAAITAAGALMAGVAPLLRYRVHRWEVSQVAVYTRRGWVVQQWQIVPLSRIQTLETHRGPLQQWFGLSTLTVTTASAHGGVRIEGLDRARAQTLVHELTALTQNTAQDGT